MKGRMMETGFYDGPSPMLFVTREIDESQTLAALNDRVFGSLIPSYICSRVTDDIIIQKERPFDY